MEFYIKGMKMPTSCSVCWALDDYGDYPRCRITEEQRGYTFPIREKRMDNCPLVPIPPHGRLKDADALIKELTLDDEDGNSGATLLMAIFLEVLKAAPTIIPAEEAE